MAADVLQDVGKAITELPSGFTPHRQIKKLFAQRRAMIEADPATPSIDWGMAESLAFGTLLVEGVTPTSTPTPVPAPLVSRTVSLPLLQ